MSSVNNTTIYENIPGEVFVESLVTAAQTMTGFYLELDSSYDSTKDDKKDILGAMLLSGKKNLLLVLTSNKKSAEILTTYATGIESNELCDDMVYDWITELINIIGGSSRAVLANSNYSFKITIPFTITGEDINLMVKKKTNNFFASFSVGEVALNLKIIEL